MSSTFDLKTYSTDTSELIEEQSKTPSWVTKGTPATKVLYESVLQARDEIAEKIISGEKLSVKERKIVKRQLAKDNNLDPSIITASRQPDLIAFIDEVDEYFIGLYKSKYKNKKRRYGVKVMLRSELESEVTSLRKGNKELEEKFCRESIEEALSNVFAENQIKLSQEIKELRKVLEEKSTTISQLRSELRQYQIKSV